MAVQRRKATRVPQGTWGGIVAPRYVIQAAVIDSREWTDVISPDGVKSYVSQIGKRAPGRDGGIMSFGTPFAKGQGGRTRGVKNRLSHAFLQALADDFVAHGAEAIRICRVEKPNEYLRVIAHLMPRELEISHNPIEAISDDQLVTYIEHIRLQLEGRVERLAIRTDTEADGEQVKLLPPI